ncbi:MAG: hypothetical protein AVDCRST_MAG27-53, partial [uncultured Craurococcus sp.]
AEPIRARHAGAPSRPARLGDRPDPVGRRGPGDGQFRACRQGPDQCRRGDARAPGRAMAL